MIFFFHPNKQFATFAKSEKLKKKPHSSIGIIKEFEKQMKYIQKL